MNTAQQRVLFYKRLATERLLILKAFNLNRRFSFSLGETHKTEYVLLNCTNPWWRAEREVSNIAALYPMLRIRHPDSLKSLAKRANTSMSSFNSVDTLGFVLLGTRPSPTSNSPQAASSPENEVIEDKPLALARKSNMPVWAKPTSPSSEDKIFSLVE